jgi:glycosyltransferase involved in cell wall biosynthesis
VPELVEDGINGFLCDPDNIVQIAAAINRLGDRETWERISSNNLIKSKTLKSRSQCINDSYEIIKNILNSP